MGTASAKSRKWKYAWLVQIIARRPEWPKHSREIVVKDEVGEVGWGVFRTSELAMRMLALSSSKGDESHEWVWSQGGL